MKILVSDSSVLIELIMGHRVRIPLSAFPS